MKKIVLLVTVLSFSFCGRVGAQSAKVQAYVQQYQALAVAEMIRTGVPASITLAQGILESGCGQSSLAKASNNHFGIKCKPEWQGDKTYHDDDHRGECFRVYPTVEASYRDHSDFLKDRPYYKDLFLLNPRDYKDWAIGLKNAGYATEKDYPTNLIRIIETYNLEQYVDIALGKMQQNGSERLASNEPGSGTPDKTASLAMDASDGGPASMNGTASVRSSEIDIPVQVRSSPASSAPAMRVAQTMVRPPAYPVAVFTINQTKVLYAPKGQSLLALAASHHLNFHRLLEINDLDKSDILSSGGLIFLEKKPKKGQQEYVISRYGETLRDISDKQGVALKSLESYNKADRQDKLAAGQKIYLRGAAPRGRELETL